MCFEENTFRESRKHLAGTRKCLENQIPYIVSCQAPVLTKCSCQASLSCCKRTIEELSIRLSYLVDAGVFCLGRSSILIQTLSPLFSVLHKLRRCSRIAVQLNYSRVLLVSACTPKRKKDHRFIYLRYEASRDPDQRPGTRERLSKRVYR